MNKKLSYKKIFPVSLRIAMIYLVLIGIFKLLCVILGSFGIVLEYQEFQVKSIASKVGSYARELTFAILFIVAGIGLNFRKLWARKLALIILVIATFYSTYNFAWGWSRGKPKPSTLIMSLIIVGIWNAVWFFLIYKKSSKAVMITQPSAARDGEKSRHP